MPPGVSFLASCDDFFSGDRTVRVPYTDVPPVITWTCPWCGDQRRYAVTSISVDGRLNGTVVGNIACPNGHRVTITDGVVTKTAGENPREIHEGNRISVVPTQQGK